jgi:hypothetical protein
VYERRRDGVDGESDQARSSVPEVWPPHREELVKTSHGDQGWPNAILARDGERAEKTYTTLQMAYPVE